VLRRKGPSAASFTIKNLQIVNSNNSKNNSEQYLIPFYTVNQNSILNPMTSVQKVQIKSLTPGAIADSCSAQSA